MLGPNRHKQMASYSHIVCPARCLFLFFYFYVYNYTGTHIEHCIRICTHSNLQTSDPIPKFPNPIMKNFRPLTHTQPPISWLLTTITSADRKPGWHVSSQPEPRVPDPGACVVINVSYRSLLAEWCDGTVAHGTLHAVNAVAFHVHHAPHRP